MGLSRRARKASRPATGRRPNQRGIPSCAEGLGFNRASSVTRPRVIPSCAECGTTNTPVIETTSGYHAEGGVRPDGGVFSAPRGSVRQASARLLKSAVVRHSSPRRLRQEGDAPQAWALKSAVVRHSSPRLLVTLSMKALRLVRWIRKRSGGPLCRQMSRWNGTRCRCPWCTSARPCWRKRDRCR